jgi:hypothetical protein
VQAQVQNQVQLEKSSCLRLRLCPLSSVSIRAFVSKSECHECTNRTKFKLIFKHRDLKANISVTSSGLCNKLYRDGHNGDLTSMKNSSASSSSKSSAIRKIILFTPSALSTELSLHSCIRVKK